MEVNLPHPVDRIILAAVMKKRQTWGRAIAFQIGIPYKALRYHVRECLTMQVEIKNLPRNIILLKR
ncbi:MAG: hypothetical protein KIY10_10905 [Thermoplasmata archaeon]|nr:hypothetical protein [Candidatus Sysuiplasma jiujiangense]MBX8643069.1 hypothetical protein [Candidatus Sysuiplasma jiujiangense]